MAVLFPNNASALRLVTAVLMEIHEEWVTGRQYLDIEEFDSGKAFYTHKREVKKADSSHENVA